MRPNFNAANSDFPVVLISSGTRDIHASQCKSIGGKLKVSIRPESVARLKFFKLALSIFYVT